MKISFTPSILFESWLQDSRDLGYRQGEGSFAPMKYKDRFFGSASGDGEKKDKDSEQITLLAYQGRLPISTMGTFFAASFATRSSGYEVVGYSFAVAAVDELVPFKTIDPNAPVLSSTGSLPIAFNQISTAKLGGNGESVFLEDDARGLYSLDQLVFNERDLSVIRNAAGQIQGPAVDQTPAQDFVASLLDRISEAVRESKETFFEAKEAIKEAGATLIEQIDQSQKALTSAITTSDTIGLDLGAAPKFSLVDILGSGPRTPSYNAREQNTFFDGRDHTLKSEPNNTLSLIASLSRKGDPSDPSPDQNDVPGQFEVSVADLLVGANFQNGFYVGPYQEAKDGVEAHHTFQTGMIDNSGAYAFGQRVDELNFIRLDPEAPAEGFGLDQLAPLGLSTDDVSSLVTKGEDQESLQGSESSMDTSTEMNSDPFVDLFEQRIEDAIQAFVAEPVEAFEFAEGILHEEAKVPELEGLLSDGDFSGAFSNTVYFTEEALLSSEQISSSPISTMISKLIDPSAPDLTL